jgi:hypothetical protein
MTHLVKIPLQSADMFVRELDFEKNVITYQIRDKLTGQLIEAETTSEFKVNGFDDRPENKIEFGSRYIQFQLALYIHGVLH